ncbi:MAG: serine/threonine protein kinase [Candidatus Obscuribacterales bacterium]|nr:serine/threonine protein kinase [Candidatus Obscuribacterales bacterium]
MAGSESVDQNVILPAGSDIADGKFEIINLIATGATAAVYRARHRLLGMEVALKVLNFSLLGRADCLARFQKEARVNSQLVHSNLAKLIGYGTLEDGRPFIAAELIEGKTLSEILSSEETLDSERAIGLFMQICDGLEALHKNGIVHRDLKPGNVMIAIDGNGAERAKIIDLGLIKELQSSDPKITKTGQILGSAAYMSPEQCRAEKPDERSDIYSFACLMYECMAGRPPFGDDAGFVTMTKQTSESAPPISQFRKDPLKPGLEEIIRIALEKEPGKRYQAVGQLRDDLKRCLDGELSARFLRPHNLPDKGTARGAMAWSGVLVGLSLIVLIGIYVSVGKQTLPRSSNNNSRVNHAKSDSKQLHNELSKAGRMAQSATLADDGQVSAALHHAEAAVKYYASWLEANPKADLADRAKAEYQLAMFYDSLANKKKAGEHEKKAEKYYLQLLNDTTNVINKADPKSYEWLIASDDAARYAKALGDLASTSNRRSDAAAFHFRRWKISRKAQPSGPVSTTFQDITIARTLHVLEDYASEEQILKSARFGATKQPVSELILAPTSTPAQSMKIFLGGPQDASTRIQFLSALYQNQMSLKKRSDAEKVWNFSVKYAESVKTPWDRAQVFLALGLDARFDKKYELGRSYADIVLENLSKLEDQSKKEVVETKIMALMLAGSTAAMLNNSRAAAHYYCQCLPYAGNRRHDWRVLDCLREYLSIAVNLQDEKLCDQLIAQYEKIAAGRDDNVQAKLVLSYFRIRRLSLSKGEHHEAIAEIIDEVIALPGLSRDSCVAEQVAIARALTEMRQFELAEKLARHVLATTNTNDLLREAYLEPARIILAQAEYGLKKYDDALATLAGVNMIFTDESIPAEFQMQRAVIGLNSSLALNRRDLIKHYIEQGEKVLPSECSPESKAGFLTALALSSAKNRELSKAVSAARRALAVTKSYCQATSYKIALQETLLASLLVNDNPSESASLYEDSLRIASVATDAPDVNVEAEITKQYEDAKKVWASKK